MRVVIDTNVLLAAGRSKHGASNRLVSLIPDNRFTPVVSTALYLEYLSVLLRPENLHAMDRAEDEVLGFLRELLSHSYRRQRLPFRWRPTLPDPDDDFVLELAIAAGCKYIVTFNKKDFVGSELFGVESVYPSEFLKLIEGL